MRQYLHDQEFLKKLDKLQNREVYIRIIALTWEELPVECIEGKATGGSISIDGTSSLRRTCSLTLVANDIVFNEFYWGLNTKFKLEIGLKNTIDSNYDDIIWFPQGIYILTSFNTTINNKSYNISLTGKDKMCMLNGELGGGFTASVEFDSESFYDVTTEVTTFTKIPVVDIIRNAIITFGNELPYNIIISDIDKYGRELFSYYGDKPLYLLRNADDGEDKNTYINFIANPDFLCYFSDTLEETTISSGVIYDNGFNNDSTSIKLKQNSSAKNYKVKKIQYGETVGYRLTDVIYPESLTAKAGESLTSVLDKIVKMLGNFEYFYDEYGRFVFQEKKNNIYNNWTPDKEMDGQIYIDFLESLISYSFANNQILTQLSHAPQLSKIKNDFFLAKTEKI